jgi:uncharacterized membrane protein
MSAPEKPRLRWLLVASLALNLLVVGALVGAALSTWRGGGGRAGHEDGARAFGDPRLRAIGNLPFLMALEPDDRAGLIGAALEQGGALRQNRRALRARFEAILAVLRQEPLDTSALRDLLAAQREALFERQQLGEALLVETIAAMSPEARAAYTERLDRSLRRGPRRGAD